MRNEIKAHVMLDKKVQYDYGYFVGIKNNRGLYWIMMIIMLALGIFGVWNIIRKAVVLGIIMLVMAVLYPALYIFMIKRRLNKQVKNTPEQFLYDVSINGTGVHVSDEKNTINLAWKRVWYIYRLEEYFYFFFNKNQGYIVPIAALEDGATAEELQHMCMVYARDIAICMDERKQKQTLPQTELDAIQEERNSLAQLPAPAEEEPLVVHAEGTEADEEKPAEPDPETPPEENFNPYDE